MKREPRLERLAAASRALRRNLDDVDTDHLERLKAMLERLLELEVLDRDAVRDLERELFS